MVVGFSVFSLWLQSSSSMGSSTSSVRQNASLFCPACSTCRVYLTRHHLTTHCKKHSLVFTAPHHMFARSRTNVSDKPEALKVPSLSLYSGKIEVNEQKYLQSFTPSLMWVTYQWCQGRNFAGEPSAITAVSFDCLRRDLYHDGYVRGTNYSHYAPQRRSSYHHDTN